jgi:hypothetical protein
MATPNQTMHRQRYLLGLPDRLDNSEMDPRHRQRLRQLLALEEMDFPHIQHDRGTLPLREAFISNGLQGAVPTELEPNDRMCDICYIDFGASVEQYAAAEGAVRLPCCGKVIGKACVAHWFEIQNTCPNCRTKLFRATRDARTSQAAHREGQVRQEQDLRERLGNLDVVSRQEQLRRFREDQREIERRRGIVNMERQRLFMLSQAFGRPEPTPERRAAPPPTDASSSASRRLRTFLPLPIRQSGHVTQSNLDDMDENGEDRAGECILLQCWGVVVNVSKRLSSKKIYAYLYLDIRPNRGMLGIPYRLRHHTVESESPRSSVRPPFVNTPQQERRLLPDFHGILRAQEIGNDDISSLDFPNEPYLNDPPDYSSSGPSRGNSDRSANRTCPSMRGRPPPTPSTEESQRRQFGSRAFQPS